jgi:hypothetical protein
MWAVVKFRRHAPDCSRLAQSARTPKDTAVLVEMAAMCCDWLTARRSSARCSEAMTNQWHGSASWAKMEPRRPGTGCDRLTFTAGQSTGIVPCDRDGLVRRKMRFGRRQVIDADV